MNKEDILKQVGFDLSKAKAIYEWLTQDNLKQVGFDLSKAKAIYEWLTQDNQPTTLPPIGVTQPVSIHYDENGDPDGIRVCALDEDFLIALHDEFDGEDVTFDKAKAERYEEWADKAHQRSEEAFERSERAVAGIPMGQPILVGHHSERAHRAAIDKSWAAMGKSVEEMHKVEAHESKAAYWERMADKIDLSMPESIEFYQHKLEVAKEYHEGVKSGKYPREHAYTLTYAKNAVNEAQKNLNLAIKLWGEEVAQ